MGGSPGTHTNQYEQERVGVDKRAYGELSKTGIQSQDEYDYYKKIYSGARIPDAFNAVFKANNIDTTPPGLIYDSNYGRYKLSNGVDLEAALTDWENYSSERKEIATYKSQEERRKSAPTSLTGTTGNVESDLAIKETTVGGETKTRTKKKKTIDTSPTVASTSQPLGIY